jgi:hypothetical protein
VDAFGAWHESCQAHLCDGMLGVVLRLDWKDPMNCRFFLFGKLFLGFCHKLGISASIWCDLARHFDDAQHLRAKVAYRMTERDYHLLVNQK